LREGFKIVELRRIEEQKRLDAINEENRLLALNGEFLLNPFGFNLSLPKAGMLIEDVHRSMPVIKSEKDCDFPREHLKFSTSADEQKILKINSNLAEKAKHIKQEGAACMKKEKNQSPKETKPADQFSNEQAQLQNNFPKGNVPQMGLPMMINNAPPMMPFHPHNNLGRIHQLNAQKAFFDSHQLPNSHLIPMMDPSLGLDMPFGLPPGYNLYPMNPEQQEDFQAINERLSTMQNMHDQNMNRDPYMKILNQKQQYFKPPYGMPPNFSMNKSKQSAMGAQDQDRRERINELENEFYNRPMHPMQRAKVLANLHQADQLFKQPYFIQGLQNQFNPGVDMLAGGQIIPMNQKKMMMQQHNVDSIDDFNRRVTEAAQSERKKSSGPEAYKTTSGETQSKALSSNSQETKIKGARKMDLLDSFLKRADLFGEVNLNGFEPDKQPGAEPQNPVEESKKSSA
jgi:hypothetical protein